MLGLELQDTAIVAVDVDETGAIRGRHQAQTGADAGSASLALVDMLATRTGSATECIGVAAIAPESAECALMLRALASRYAGRFLNEGAIATGTAAAVAESWIGAARGASNVVLLAVDRHASGGIVLNGQPVRGTHGRAAAVAWLSLNPVEREDYRKAGCVQAEVSAAGIVRRLVWRIKAGDGSRVAEAAGGDLQAITVDQILDGARAGDGVAISVMRDTAKYLGMAAANLVVVADPAVLVVGGIMARAADVLLEPLRVELARRLPPATMQALVVAPATLGPDAAAIGAARLGAAAQR